MPTAFDQLKQKSANTGGSMAPVSSAPAPVATGSAFDKLKVKGAIPSTPAPAPQESASEGFVKGLVSAPATMVARPFQAIQATGQAIQDFPKINQYERDAHDISTELGTLAEQLKAARGTGTDTTALKARVVELNAELLGKGKEIQPTLDRKQFSGGVIAPAPQNASDVVKDVGRGAETVALGLGPVSGGALFGAGASLENQGSDVFSLEGAGNLALSTGVGAGGGKLLGLIGKPLINASGKVIGTITPQIIKDISGKGAQAVSEFVARHEILPEGAFKDAVNQIPKVAEKVDEGVNNLFNKAGSKIKSTVQSQYPGATSDNIAKHYEKVELDRLFEPATVPGKTFNKSADAFNQSQKQGVDLRRVAGDNKIYASDLVNDGKFDTNSVADALSSEAMSGGPQILRPALAAAEPGVQRVPLSEIRNEMLARLKKVPDTKLSPQQKLALAKRIVAEYGDQSAAVARYRDGYSLTNLYDSKLQTSGNLYKTPKGGGAQSIADNLTSQGKQMEAQVFDDLLQKNAPKELGLDKYFKAQQERFQLANYLRTLDGNKAPQTLFQRGVKRAAQLGGATTGASVAGPFGMFSGYQFGGIMADTFASASNPVKIAFLKNIGKSEPEIYQIMKTFATDAEVARSMRPLLSEGSKVDANLQKVKNERGSIEMGPSYSRPTTPRERAANNLKQNLNSLFNTKQLPAPSPRIITPNTGGTPNQISNLYKAGGDEGAVGGVRQRTKPKK